MMNIKQAITLALITLATNIPPRVMAQQPMQTADEANTLHYVYMGKLDYANKNSIGTLISGALQGKVVTQEAKFIPVLKDAVRGGASHARTVVLKDASNDMEEFARQSDAPCLLLEGTVASIGSNTELDKKTGKTRVLRGIVSLTLSLKDVRSGQIVTSRRFERQVSAYGPSFTKTTDQLLTDAIGYVANDVAHYFNSIFPVHGVILQKGLEKKGKLKQVYISLGSQWGVQEGTSFIVYAVSSVAGRQVKREIGKLKATEVQGEDITICKVSKGEEDISAALKQGQRLVVISQ